MHYFCARLRETHVASFESAPGRLSAIAASWTAPRPRSLMGRTIADLSGDAPMEDEVTVPSTDIPPADPRDGTANPTTTTDPPAPTLEPEPAKRRRGRPPLSLRSTRAAAASLVAGENAPPSFQAAPPLVAVTTVAPVPSVLELMVPSVPTPPKSAPVSAGEYQHATPPSGDSSTSTSGAPPPPPTDAHDSVQAGVLGHNLVQHDTPAEAISCTLPGAAPAVGVSCVETAQRRTPSTHASGLFVLKRSRSSTEL
jgi:hypothetical protein